MIALRSRVLADPSRWLAPALVALSVPTAYVAVNTDWKLSLGAVIAALVVLISTKHTGFLIAVAALVLMAHQTYLHDLREALAWARWLPLSLLAFMAFATIAVSGRLFRKPQLVDQVAVLFLAFALISTSYSIAPFKTLERTITVMLLYLAVFWAIWGYAARFGEDRVVERLLQAAFIIYLAGLILIPLGGYQTDIWNRPQGAFDAFTRFQGLMENPNSVGLLTAVLLPLALWRMARRPRRFADVLLVIAMIVSLVLSSSRTGMLGAMVGSGYFLLMQGHGAWRKFLVVALPAVAVSFLLIVNSGLIDNYRSSYTQRTAAAPAGFFDSYLRTDNLSTGSGRVNLWSGAVNLITARPLHGYGFGTERELFLQGVVRFEQHHGYIFGNSYVGLATQLGVPGVLLLFGPLFLLALSEYRRTRSREVPRLRYALQAVLLAGLVLSIGESWIYSVGNAQSFPFWVSVMLLLSMRSRAIRPKPSLARADAA